MRDIYEAWVAAENGAYCGLIGDKEPRYVCVGVVRTNENGYKDTLVRVKRRDIAGGVPIELPIERVKVMQFRGTQASAVEKIERLRKGLDRI